MDKYIDQIKNIKLENPNFGELEEKILEKSQKKKIHLFPKLILAGCLSLLILIGYLYIFNNQNNNLVNNANDQTAVEYVFNDGSESSNDIIMSYIFE